MMGGYGPGGGRGYGPGYGMGPGMMGGYGPGYGMGPGMMGGYGRGYGMGLGMMGGPLGALDLTDAQRAQINKIQDETRRKNWDVMGKMQDERAKLRDAYASGTADRAAILDAYKRIGDLRLQRIENGLDARERIQGVLTKEQREQLRRWGPWWMGDDAG
ncbi:MAG: Spy/CpxP family protein refolding chaperone [Burkholderiales bacterium]|nr:Spy/CpxP family protein refolding chaperone [Burkholderiales bacterium]